MPPRLYTELAEWWDLLAPTDHTADEARLTLEVMQAGAGAVARVLELGCGAAPVMGHFPTDIHRTLVDLSPQMLSRAAANNPGATLLQADMRDPEIHQYLEKIRLLAEALGVTGTPEFIIGDAILSGGATADELRAELGRQRAQSRERT